MTTLCSLPWQPQLGPETNRPHAEHKGSRRHGRNSQPCQQAEILVPRATQLLAQRDCSYLLFRILLVRVCSCRRYFTRGLTELRTEALTGGTSQSLAFRFTRHWASFDVVDYDLRFRLGFRVWSSRKRALLIRNCQSQQWRSDVMPAKGPL